MCQSSYRGEGQIVTGGSFCNEGGDENDGGWQWSL